MTIPLWDYHLFLLLFGEVSPLLLQAEVLSDKVVWGYEEIANLFHPFYPCKFIYTSDLSSALLVVQMLETRRNAFHVDDESSTPCAQFIRVPNHHARQPASHATSGAHTCASSVV